MASTTSLLRLGHRIPVVVWTWSAPLRHFMSWKLDPQLLQLLRDTGKFRRWGLSGERALLGTCLWRECVLHDLFPLLSASQLSQGGQFCSTMCSRPCCVSRHTLRGMEPDNHTLKPSDKINLSSFKLLLSGISHALSPTHTHKHTHKKNLTQSHPAQEFHENSQTDCATWELYSTYFLSFPEVILYFGNIHTWQI